MKALDYQHVSLVPRVVSRLEHRSEANCSVDFCGLKLNVPVIAAPMPDVCNGKMAYELINCGCLGIIHRFQTIEEQCNACFYTKTHPSQPFKIHSACAIGITGDWEERFEKLYNIGCRIFCIDIANGANKQIEKVISHIQNIKDKIYIIAGNIASKEGYLYLADLGVDAIRCGIAGGSVCSTKLETGIYYPMFFLLREVREAKNFYGKNAQIIADGGIKNTGDICKALVFADIVMMGGMFAACKESPGQVLKVDGKKFKVLRGAASFSVQQEFKDEPKYVEGHETLIPYGGPVHELCRRIRMGIESSMSYMDSRTLWEFKNKASWVETV